MELKAGSQKQWLELSLGWSRTAGAPMSNRQHKR